MGDFIECLAAQKGGFNFDNYRRNRLLVESGAVKYPPMRKTGTTICGVKCNGAIVLGADTRATEGPIVADKNCSKLHRIADSIYCAGAGVAGDLVHTTRWLESRVELHRLNTHCTPRVSMALTVISRELFKYQGYKVCALVLGGVDCDGPSLYKVHPHGSTDNLPYASMGSGSLNALAVLEAGFKENMTIEEGKFLVAKAISAGIFNDLGSGGNVDLCVITREGTKHHRSYESPNPRLFRAPQQRLFPKGTTAYLREKVEEFKKEVVVVDEDVDMLDG